MGIATGDTVAAGTVAVGTVAAGIVAAGIVAAGTVLAGIVLADTEPELRERERPQHLARRAADKSRLVAAR